MEEILLKIHESVKDGRPFSAYAKPGSNVLNALFQKDSTAHSLNDFSESGFVFAPFGEGVVCFIPGKDADRMSAQLTPVPFATDIKSPQINETAKAHFEALVAKGVAEIKGGKFEKLVLSRTEAVDTNHSVTEIFGRLLSAYPQAMRYCFYHPASGLWMGATPEQLLKAESNTIHTVALAGTQLYADGQEAVWPEKEQQEQRFVTDYITSELQDIAANIRTTAPYTFRAGNIVHIKTDIKAELKPGATVGDAVNALHPTPAVCGLPKAAARDFIITNEGYNRSYYSGFLGELNLDAKGHGAVTDLFVNLRCLRLDGNVANLYIGCGVTEGSDPEKEFIETVNKSMTMRRVL